MQRLIILNGPAALAEWIRTTVEAGQGLITRNKEAYHE